MTALDRDRNDVYLRRTSTPTWLTTAAREVGDGVIFQWQRTVSSSQPDQLPAETGAIYRQGQRKTSSQQHSALLRSRAEYGVSRPSRSTEQVARR